MGHSIRTRLVGFRVLLELGDKVVEFLLPLMPLLQAALLQLGVVLLEELFVRGLQPPYERWATDADGAAAGSCCQWNLLVKIVGLHSSDSHGEHLGP